MTAKQGWGNPRPFNAKSKFHYFVGGQSLCGKWGFFTGDIEEGQDDHSDNCPDCRKKKAKRDAALAATPPTAPVQSVKQQADGDVMADAAFYGTREAYLQNQVETLKMDVQLGAEEVARLTRELQAANARANAAEAKVERAMAIPEAEYPNDATYYIGNTDGRNVMRGIFRKALTDDSTHANG